MIYFLILILFLFLAIGFSQLIKIQSIEESIFGFFVHQLTTLTLLITLFAVLITKGKTLFILFLLLFIYLFLKKKILFVIPKKTTKSIVKYIALLIPILSIQFLLQFDLTNLTPFLPSADVLAYASYASSMVQFGVENKYEALNHLYPEIFSGIGPYHYYEIWFTGLLGCITGKSYVLLLQLVVYPYLIWLFILGIASVFECYRTKITYKEYIFCFLLLFVGPVYLKIYETVFNDGDFFSSTVFTVPGFIKQTLAFSYYGQKHLPIYLFGILSFLFLLKKQYSSSILIGLMASVCSFGVFPGVFGGFGLLFLVKKELQTKTNLIIFISIGLLSVLVMSLFKMGIHPEISEKTFYFNDFLKYLNLKGELIRIGVKIIVPFLWFTVLYFPYILLFYVYRKNIFSVKEIKWMYLLIVFLFISGAFFISLVQGLNSDQFLTNLIPLFNLSVLLTLIHLYFQLPNKKIIFAFAGLTLFINIFFIINYSKNGTISTKKLYDETIIAKVTEQLKNTKTSSLIAYLLSDKTITTKPPSNWYGEKPGKPFFLENYVNLVNINYPYTTYDRNTSSIAFSPDNQMRFYLKNKKIPINKMGEIQVEFLKSHKIKWIFCGKGVQLSDEILPKIETTFYDRISGERYVKLK